MIFSACGFSLFGMIFSMTLLGWLMRLIGDDQGLGPRGWPFFCLPYLVASCRESSDYLLSTCLDQFCWDIVNSCWLPFLQWLYCSLHFFVKDGVVIRCVCLGTVQYWWISTGLLIVQLRVVFFPSVQYLSFVFEAFSWTILDSSSFPLFHGCQIYGYNGKIMHLRKHYKGTQHHDN